MQPRVRVRVPGSVANLGPAYDCAGVALDLWITVDFTRLDEGPSMAVDKASPGGGPPLPWKGTPTGPSNLVLHSLAVTFRRLGVETPPPFEARICGDLPVRKGLGSSSAAVVAGVLGAVALAGKMKAASYIGEDEVLLRLMLGVACDLEGHPDNSSAALLGGLVFSYRSEGENAGEWLAARVPVFDGILCTVLIPEVTLDTPTSRALLDSGPPITREDASFNAARTGLLVLAFQGRLELLREAMRDRLHQPVRAAVVPHLYPCIAAALEAGAAGACLSGSGPSVAAFSAEGAARAGAVEAAMLRAAPAVFPTALTCLVAPRGASILEVFDE